MYLSYLPDEATPDFADGLRLGAELGLRHVEIRLVDGVNVLDLTDAQIKRAQALVAAHDMTISAIATPFFKCALPGTESDEEGPMHGARSVRYADHLALLPRGVEIAQAFGASLMRIFSFWDAPTADFWPALTEAVAATVAATQDSNVTPCLENEGACCIKTSADLAETARRLTDPALKLIWDPGNSSYRGMAPRAEDFSVFADRIALVHLKDATYDQTAGKASARLIGEGDTNFATELTRLEAAGYRGALTLEPHYCPAGDCVVGLRQSVTAIKAIAASVGVALQ